MISYIALTILVTIFSDASVAHDALQEFAKTNIVIWIICDGVWLNLFFNRK